MLQFNESRLRFNVKNHVKLRRILQFILKKFKSTKLNDEEEAKATELDLYLKSIPHIQSSTIIENYAAKQSEADKKLVEQLYENRAKLTNSIDYQNDIALQTVENKQLLEWYNVTSLGNYPIRDEEGEYLPYLWFRLFVTTQYNQAVDKNFDDPIKDKLNQKGVQAVFEQCLSTSDATMCQNYITLGNSRSLTGQLATRAVDDFLNTEPEKGNIAYAYLSFYQIIQTAITYIEKLLLLLTEQVEHKLNVSKSPSRAKHKRSGSSDFNFFQSSSLKADTSDFGFFQCVTENEELGEILLGAIECFTKLEQEYYSFQKILEKPAKSQTEPISRKKKQTRGATFSGSTPLRSSITAGQTNAEVLINNNGIFIARIATALKTFSEEILSHIQSLTQPNSNENTEQEKSLIKILKNLLSIGLRTSQSVSTEEKPNKSKSKERSFSL